MSQSEALTPSFSGNVLPFSGMQAVYVQALFISSAIVLPIIAHAVNAPIRLFLPMHWPVIIAGLLYGWRAGAITGVLAPLVSYLFSGFPLPAILPSMTAELFVYGFLTGLLFERYKVNEFLSIGAAIVAGRLVFISSVLLTNKASISDIEYFTAALVPGFAAAILQILSLPFLSRYIMKQYHREKQR